MGKLKDKWRIYLVGGGLLLSLFALLTLGSRQLSFTADEPAYIAGGYALLAQGKEAFSLLPQRGYPPLLCGMEALLIYLAAPTVPLERLSGWPTHYDSFIRALMPYLPPWTQMAMVARMPVVMLTVILGAVVFRLGKDLWGPTAGSLALVALVFDPTLLAHGRLATTDAGVVALGTAALYAVWRLTEKPSWRWALGTGILLGLTMLAKVSGIFWTIATGLMVLGTIVQRRQEGWNVELLVQGITAVGLSLLILWAGYGFTWGWVRGVSFPVPAPAHWESLFYLDQYTSEVFALGQRRYGRWWWYYPLAFLIKNPLPLLIAWPIGLVELLRRPSFRSRLLIFGLFPLLYTGAAILKGMNIGYRHMLPIHPFLYLVIGGGLGRWVYKQRGRLWQRWLLGILGVWYVITTIRIFPYEIAYFNELVGGPESGYRYLVDSNLDWGQSGRTVSAYLQAHPDVRTEPPISKFRPAPGQYLVGASHLQGVGIGDPYAYEWFRHWKAQTTLGYSVLVYDVHPYEMTWVAQCETPVAPLSDDLIARGTGRNDLRNVRFDCTRTWLYPDEGTLPGIYVLHHDLVGSSRLCLPSFLPCPRIPDDPFMARHLARARFSYEQAYDGRRPAFVLYEMSSTSMELPAPSTVYIAFTDTPSAATGDFALLSIPVSLEGPLDFLNTVAYLEEDVLEVETWWRVTDGPITRPFSIMGHLLSSEGETIGLADGLGVSPLALASGDVVVHRHRFPRPAGGTEVSLQTGAYWLDTMERWTVTDAPRTDAFLIRLHVSR